MPSSAGVTQLLSLQLLVWGAAVHGWLGNQAVLLLFTETASPERESYQGSQRPMCTLPSVTQDLLTLLLQQWQVGDTQPPGWLRGSSSTLMLFPAAGGMFGTIKDGCGRVESNLQTTLDLAALRWSCLHAGGTTACSVACLETEQE